MLSPRPELVWQGRIHLGDEPGIYGDAAYAGLAAELPLTLEKSPQATTDSTELVVRTEGVRTFQGYPGHLIEVFGHQPSAADPLVWEQVTLATARLTTADDDRKVVPVTLPTGRTKYFVSVRVRADTSVPAGLYDDFVLTRLLNGAKDFSFVASFGFQPPAP
ncbi:hypothetical protein [Amycolatopsis silviterrae]|uniref:Uncharacterized protein n=1 Tax=Amycolatopsis silviterrae TaxID=1656914 RepID=A0ABW5H3B0_9PSEU